MTFSQSWGDDPFTKMNHTQVPNALVIYSSRLKLTAEECWLIVCILKFKYDERDPYPSEETLAKLFGQTPRNIRRVAAKIRDKNLLEMPKIRLDSGHYSHTVFKFEKLRNALNECYFTDHPEERSTTGQKRPMGGSNHRTDSSKTPDKTVQTTGQIKGHNTGQKRPTNKTVNQTLEKELEEDVVSDSSLRSSFRSWDDASNADKDEYRKDALVLCSRHFRAITDESEKDRIIDEKAKLLYEADITAT